MTSLRCDRCGKPGDRRGTCPSCGSGDIIDPSDPDDQDWLRQLRARRWERWRLLMVFPASALLALPVVTIGLGVGAFASHELRSVERDRYLQAPLCGLLHRSRYAIYDEHIDQLCLRNARNIRVSGGRVDTIDLAGASPGRLEIFSTHIGSGDLSGLRTQKTSIHNSTWTDTSAAAADLGEARITNMVFQGGGFRDTQLVGAFIEAVRFGDEDTDVVLHGARFDGARVYEVDFVRADLRGASFVGASVHEALFLDVELGGADFSGARVTAPDLRGVDLSAAVLSGAEFLNPIVDHGTRWPEGFAPTGPVLIEAGAGLEDANLYGRDIAKMSLEGINLHDCDCRHIDASGSVLIGADLRSADLRDASLDESVLRGADLRHADLEGASLRNADLSEADLQHADLRDADLRGADLRGADLRRVTLEGADLRQAAVEGVVWSPGAEP